MYECIRCFENCHINKIPYWGNRCLANKIEGKCFVEIGSKIKVE